MKSPRYISLEKLNEKEKSILGFGLIGLALVTGGLMYHHPQGLKVPAFIGILALSIFFLSGIAVLVSGKIAKEKYHHLMQILILLMSVIPLWIAFDPREKQCHASFFFLSGEISCRLGFALGGFILLIILFLTFSSYRKK